jgi:hypothetical protein
VHEERWHKVNDVCDILGLTRNTPRRILPEDLNINLYTDCKIMTTNKTDFFCELYAKSRHKEPPITSYDFFSFPQI